MHARFRLTTAAALALMLAPGLSSVPCPAVAMGPDAPTAPPGTAHGAAAATPAAAARAPAVSAVGGPAEAPAKPTLTIGLFAERPAALLGPRWAPLAAYLNAALPDDRVVLEVLDADALAAGLAGGRLDVILTNPVHFLALREQSHRARAIATLARRGGAGPPARELGGVILARADAPAVRRLSDLRGLRIAATGPYSLGGSVAQLAELRAAGVAPRALDLRWFAGEHDAVIDALLAGAVQFGFVRAGIPEARIAEGTLPADALVVVGARDRPDFPFALSTALYPEWPVVALPRLDDRVARRLAGALLSLPPEHPAARAAGIDGFHVPADYRPVEQVLRALRIAPFEHVPEVTWTQMWRQHGRVFLAIAFAMLLILLLSAALVWRNLQLRAARAAAQQAERRWVLALDGAGQGVWDWDLPSGRVFFSRQWKAMLGYAPPELSNRLEEWRVRVHPDDLPMAEAAIERHCRGETPTLRVVYRMIAKDGGLRWILDQGMAFTRGADGRPLRMVGTHTDITAWRATEDALEAQQALFAAVVSQARDGVVVVDPATQGFVEFNDAACSGLGYSREAFARLRLTDIQAEFDQAEIDARFADLVAAGHSSFTTRHRHRDGTERVVRTSNQVIQRDGRLLVAAIWADITEQEAAARALRASETRFRATFEQAAVGMAHVGLDGRWLRVNQALCDSLGYSREDLLATDFQRLTHPDDLDGDLGLVARALAGEIASFSLEKRYLRRDGSAFWAEVTGALVHTEQGAPDYFIAVVEDIDQRRRDAAALAEVSARYLSLVEHMRDGVAIFRAVDHGADFRFVVINRAGARVLRLPLDCFAGQRLSRLFPAIGATRLPEALREVWAGGAPQALPAAEYRDQRIALWWESYLYRLPSGEVVAVFADVTAQKAAEQALLESEATLQQLAYFDPLTGLPNRRLLLDRLDQAIAVADREHRGLAVCSLDLDDFKPINERFGEPVGDRLLVAVGERLRELLRPGDTVARWGGDEFALLLTDIDGVNGCASLLSQVLARLAQPFPVAAGEQGLSACIGVALYPQDQGDGDALLRHADHAMFLAKQRGQGGYQFFDPESDALAGVRRDELRRIGAAIDGGELVLYYQPIVNMREGSVVAVEALVRWQHPTRGLLTPAAFVPRIEGTALIRQLDAWVLAQALADLAGWIDRGLRLQLHVNVSANTLTAPGFIDTLSRLLAAWPQIEPRMIDIEVLETAALADLEAVTQVIRAGRGLGFRFALDDFGTGYSSLTYVRHLPADTLKIDQSFVRDMLDDHNDQHIVEAVIGLARAFDRAVVAEGVESDAHGVLLLRFGCEQAQGFGIARPMPAAQVPGWVAGWQAPAPWGGTAARPWPIADQPLLSMEAEHHGWVEAVLARARGEPGARVEPLDEHQCRFGRWYDGEGQRRYGHLAAFRAIAPLHAEVHRLGGALLADGPDADLAQVAALARASEELIERIKRIEDAVNARAAALFADASGAAAELGAGLVAGWGPAPAALSAPSSASGGADVAGAGATPEVPGCTCGST